ncbi:MAG: DUF3618 domain-containing protein [Candidatus Dormibacteraeota bacterium]|nr:DUF3618 domain-containing protein [Candidatus Dormibacteraeota bacterium]
MGEDKDPEVIAREIEETRERMGERLDALTYKADVSRGSATRSPRSETP